MCISPKRLGKPLLKFAHANVTKKTSSNLKNAFFSSMSLIFTYDASLLPHCRNTIGPPPHHITIFKPPKDRRRRITIGSHPLIFLILFLVKWAGYYSSLDVTQISGCRLLMMVDTMMLGLMMNRVVPLYAGIAKKWRTWLSGVLYHNQNDEPPIFKVAYLLLISQKIVRLTIMFLYLKGYSCIWEYHLVNLLWN